MTAFRRENLLSVDDVHLSFGSKTILEGVNVRIDNLLRDSDDGRANNTGQIVAFLGPSGIGKTQLLRILAGLQKPTKGQVFVGANHEPIHPGLVGMVSQQYVLFRHLTIEGNLFTAARQHGYRGDEARDRVNEMLDRFGLSNSADMYPAQLSGGQRQRAAIAQQLLCSQHFLLMDEPTAGLDPLSKETVCSFISQVANQHDLNTIIIVTHDTRAAISLADTLWLMGRSRDAQGKIISGARIVEQYDLIERGLMWHPDVTGMPEFAATEREIVQKFKLL